MADSFLFQFRLLHCPVYQPELSLLDHSASGPFVSYRAISMDRGFPKDFRRGGPRLRVALTCKRVEGCRLARTSQARKARGRTTFHSCLRDCRLSVLRLSAPRYDENLSVSFFIIRTAGLIFVLCERFDFFLRLHQRWWSLVSVALRGLMCDHTTVMVNGTCG